MSLLLSSISQGLLWAIMAIGVYLTFRILDVADLTAEGSFPLGAAVSTSLIVKGVSPIIAVFFALISGMLAGFVSGFLHTKWKIPALLSGIITMTGLYSINLRIMGQANVSLLGHDTLMRTVQAWGLDKTDSVLLVGFLVVFLVIIVLHLFFHTQVGLAIRATGDNYLMSEANGIRTNWMKVIGYMISNGLIALSGALLSQNNGSSDISMGIGTIVIGLASIIIAEVFFRNLSIAKRLITIVLGSIIYRLLILYVLQFDIDPKDLNLFSAILLAVALYSPIIKDKYLTTRNGKIKQPASKGDALK